MTSPTVATVATVLDSLYPPGAAEPWDKVGLAVGSPAATVSKVLYTVDCTTDVVAEAVQTGADLVVAHHPLLLRGVHAVREDQPKGQVVTRLVRSGISLFVAHTNADKPPGGVASALADVLGVTSCRPLVPEPGPQLDVLITFVPASHRDALLAALSEAGAGAIGDYDQCSFGVEGHGTFRPLAGAQPYVGAVGERAEVPEVRLEMVLPPDRRRDVVSALRSAHPYETPAYHLVEAASDGADDAGLGRIGRLPEPTTLDLFVRHVLQSLPRSGGGIRVSGPPHQPVRTVAVQAGAGGDLLEVVRHAGADVYLTSDLRHHPATEAREWADAPALVDVPHWAAEATWLPVVQRLVSARLAEAGIRLPSAISTVVTDPWRQLT